ncbi:hypothetical protein [Romboutsia lituseburensis]|uniref:hypothetical protein n=1 Tax=Romboutsia lituseburensis TaxID=1537 RepID=UPI0022EB8C13|nr:hypothetical protein [Romboutsia lituseburensis]
MKKLITLAILLITLTITGCTQTKDFQIEYNSLSKEQEEIINLTGNRIFRYNLENLPNDKNYQLNLVYEVYKDGKKIKEELITSSWYEPTKEKLEDATVAINMQDNKVRCQVGVASSSLDIKEDISQLSYHYFTSGKKINLGDEIYLFHGVKGDKGILYSDLGLLSDKDLNENIKENELNVFVKLQCKEVSDK